MEEAARLNIYGIKCDNPSCDYQDESVHVDNYSEWINKPCPKCESNLLTQDDYDNVQMIINATDLINQIFDKDESEEVHTLNIEMDGSGKIGFNLKDDKDVN